MKLRVILLALAVSASHAWAQHGQPGHHPGGEGGAGSEGPMNPLNDAKVIYTFDDIDNLGYEYSGAKGTVADFERSDDQYAVIANNASFDPSTGGAGFCTWINFETNPRGTWQTIASKYNGTPNQSQFWFYPVSSSGHLTALWYGTNGSQSIITDTEDILPGVDYLLCTWLDPADDRTRISTNAGTPVVATAPNALTADLNQGTSDFNIGSTAYPTLYSDARIGPAYYWSNAIPTTGIITSIYAGGRGKPCGALTTSDKVGMVSCWNMTETGGTYYDSIGSNDLTATNGPIAQGVGIVSAYDTVPVNDPGYMGGAEGYAAHFAVASTQYAIAGTSNVLSIPNGEDLLACSWIDVDTLATTRVVLSKDTGADPNREYIMYVDATGRLNSSMRDEDDNATSAATASGVITVGTRTYACASFDASAGAAGVSVDAGTFLVDGTPLGEVNWNSGTAIFEIGAYNTTALSFDGAVGASVMYMGADLDFASLASSTYNSGKGKDCREYSASEMVDRVACWNMGETVTATSPSNYDDQTQITTAFTKADSSASTSWPYGTIMSGEFYGTDSVSITATVRADDVYSMLCLDDGGMSTGVTVDADYCIYNNSNGILYIWENGANASGTTHGSYDPGDTYEVRRSNGTVTYWENGSLVYTSTVSSTSPLRGVAAARDAGAGYYDLYVNSVVPTWIYHNPSNEEIGWGMNPLGAVSTPTQDASLVEQANSGMGAYVVTASSQAFSLDVGNDWDGTISISAWFNMTGATDTGVLSIGDTATDATPMLTLQQQNTTQLRAFHGGAYTAALTYSPLQWHHVVWTFDSSDNSYSLTLDGGTPVTGTAAQTNTSATNKLWVGAGYNAYATAVVDNVTVWDRVLSSDEIKRLSEDVALVPVRH